MKETGRYRRLCGGVVALVAAALSASPAPALADKQIFADSLGSGWTDYSWAVVNLTATTKVHTGSASISVQADNWEALYLYTPNISVNGYTGLTFWVNGGTAGGQLLEVLAVKGGAAQNPVQLAPLPTNSWRAVSLSMASLGVARAPDFNGFWLRIRTAEAVPVFYVDDIKLVSGVEPDPTPRIETPAGATTNSFTFLLIGIPGETYVTETSVDLGEWKPVSTNELTAISMPVTVSTTNSRQFFRVLWRP